MPRTHLGHIKNGLLRALYPACGSLRTAQQELRWMRQEIPKKNLYSAILKRRIGMPLSYVLGTTPFGSLLLNTPKGVLIPRWETEEWACKLIREIKHGNWKPKRVLDIGTGTGCILLLLAHELGIEGVGMDISRLSEQVFRRNCLGAGVDLQFLRQSFFDPLPRGFQVDLVVSNPPYIPESQFWTETQPSVALWEPRTALLGSYETLAAVSDRIFESGARMAVIEVGSQEQVDFCTNLFEKQNWAARGEKDLAGLPRTVWARRKTIHRSEQENETRGEVFYR